MKTNLQKLRKEAGFRSARVFAEFMDIPLGTYTDYEQGRRNFALEQAWLFADALGEAMGRFVTLDELAGRKAPQGQAHGFEDVRQRRLNEAWEELSDGGRAHLLHSAESECALERGSAMGAQDADSRRAV